MLYYFNGKNIFKKTVNFMVKFDYAVDDLLFTSRGWLTLNVDFMITLLMNHINNLMMAFHYFINIISYFNLIVVIKRLTESF